MLKQSIIEVCKSPYASLVVLCQKQNGKNGWGSINLTLCCRLPLSQFLGETSYLPYAPYQRSIA